MLLVVVIVTPRVLDLGIPKEPSPWAKSTGRSCDGLGLQPFGKAYGATFSNRGQAPSHEPIERNAARRGTYQCGLPRSLGNGARCFCTGTGTTMLWFAVAGVFGGALVEELLLRAILFRIAEQAFGTTAAVVISAVIFGLLHGLNHGATAMSDVAIALEAGILLALAYALTHNLWFAVGIHLGWNFAEGNIYGAAVSGTAPAHTLMRVSLSGTQALTGGTFGPEASVVSIVVCLLASGLLLLLVVRKHEWTPVGFRLTLP
jgi:membrane protease YdiL (CAAX protease family)